MDGPGPDLDLTGAVLEYFDLSHRRIGGLLLRHASLYSSTNLSGCVFTGQAYFTAAGTDRGRLVGVFRCRDATFLDRAWFSGTAFSERTNFSDTAFKGATTFKGATFAKEVLFSGTTFADSADVQLPDGWKLEPRNGGYVATPI